MIQLHKIKLQQRFADAKLDGDKMFEVRINDRYYQKGDLIQYSVLTNADNNLPIIPIVTHPLNERIFEITYVYFGPGVEQGYVVLGEQDVTQEYLEKTGKFENLQKLEWEGKNE